MAFVNYDRATSPPQTNERASGRLLETRSNLSGYICLILGQQALPLKVAAVT